MLVEDAPDALARDPIAVAANSAVLEEAAALAEAPIAVEFLPVALAPGP